MRWFSRYFVLTWVLGWLTGVTISAHGQRYVFQSYRQGDGLGNLSISAIAFDRDGFLWVGTENGLYRFQGAQFERYGKDKGLPERAIVDVYVDAADRVWAATVKDLYLWNGRSFKQFDTTPTPVWRTRRMATVDSTHILLIRERDLLEYTLDAAGRPLAKKPFFTPEQHKTMPKQGDVTTVQVAPDGTVWAGCGYVICSSRGGVLRIWGPEDGVPALAVHQEFWLDIQVDRLGGVWAASSRHLVQLARGGTRFTDHTVPGMESMGSQATSPIIFDKQGRVLRTTDAGLARWDGVGWQQIGVANGLPAGEPINSLALDRNGDLWIGNGSSGVHHWVGYENWEGWTAKDGLPDDSIWTFLQQDSGHLLVGTEKGPARLDIASGKVSPFFVQREWRDGQVSGMVKDVRGEVWASTWAGKVVRINPVTLRSTVAGNPFWFLFGAAKGSGADLLFLAKEGIYAMDTPERSASLHALPEVDTLLGGKKSAFSSCTSPNRDLWVYADGGLLRLSDGHWSREPVQGLELNGLGMMSLSCSRDGALWLAGLDSSQEPGVWHLIPNAGSRIKGVRAERLALPDFLRGMLIHTALEDRRGWLWVGTDVGVAVWNGSGWRHFTQESGLIWNDTNQTVMQEAPDGTIWIGTSGGMAHFMHPETAFDPVPLSVAITSIQRGEQRFLPGERIVLPWSRIPIQFAFASPPGWNRSVMQFNYRIAGLSPAWTRTGEMEAAMPSMPPGAYRFEVFARNPETGASSAVAAVAFEILAPWWRSWWFVAMCVVAIGLLLLLALWGRTRSLLLSQRRLEALVQERTRELEMSREALRVQATHDMVTGLYNRAAILRLLKQEMERARREGTLLAVLLADLDHFKRVNDTYGHMAGDAALVAYAEAIDGSIRSYDMAGRYGGEEFLFLLVNLQKSSVEERLASIHRKLTNLNLHYEGQEIWMTCSIGVSFLIPGDIHSTAAQLLSTADQALYEAKRLGRNCVVRAGYNGLDEMSVVGTLGEVIEP